MAFSALLYSCNNNEDDYYGYFEVDGERKLLEVAAIFPSDEELVDITGRTAYLTEIGLSGGPKISIGIDVITPGQNLISGTYIIDEINPLIGYSRMDVASFAVYFGTIFKYIDYVPLYGHKAEGELIVSINKDIYTLDFNATFDGHIISMHYQGPVKVFSPT